MSNESQRTLLVRVHQLARDSDALAEDLCELTEDLAALRKRLGQARNRARKLVKDVVRTADAVCMLPPERK